MNKKNFNNISEKEKKKTSTVKALQANMDWSRGEWEGSVTENKHHNPISIPYRSSSGEATMDKIFQARNKTYKTIRSCTKWKWTYEFKKERERKLSNRNVKMAKCNFYCVSVCVYFRLVCIFDRFVFCFRFWLIFFFVDFYREMNCLKIWK